MSHIDLKPVGSVAQMKTAQAVVKAFDAIGQSRLSHLSSHDLMMSWDTMEFQSILDASLGMLRLSIDVEAPAKRAAAIAIIPDLYTEA